MTTPTYTPRAGSLITPSLTNPRKTFDPAKLAKLRDHGNGIALIPARTETAMFYGTVWGHTDGVLFLKGRPHFHFVDGRRAAFNSGAPIALVAYGASNLEALQRSGLGWCVVGHNA